MFIFSKLKGLSKLGMSQLGRNSQMSRIGQDPQTEHACQQERKMVGKSIAKVQLKPERQWFKCTMIQMRGKSKFSILS